MRKSLLLLVLLLFPASSLAVAPAFVRNGSNVSNTTGTTIAITGQTTTAGHLGVVICSAGVTSATLSVADGGTDTFTAIGSPFSSANEGSTVQMFYVQSLAGGTKTITCTTTSSPFRNIYYYEFSGQGSSALDANGTNSSDTGGNSATPQISITTSSNTTTVGAILCGNTCSIGTCTPNACTNTISDTFGDLSAMQANNAGGATALKFTQTSGTYQVVAASFKGPSSPTMPPVVL